MPIAPTTKQSRFPWPYLATAGLLCGAGGASQAGGGDSETDYFADIPVVVSATRLSQRVDDTPAAVTVIDRDLIQAAGIVEFADILRLVPGFQVGHTSGNLFTITAHGTGAPWFSRVQVLIDGQSRYHTAFSGLDWANLGVSLADVERVEVVRGANIPTYGANAIMGTINIVTRQPFQDRGLFLQATAGSRDRADGVSRYAGDLAGMDYRLTLEHRENRGFKDVDDDTRLNDLSFRGILNLTPDDELDIHVGYTKSTLGLQLHFDFPLDERKVSTDYQFVRWNHASGSEESFYLQFTRDHYDTREDTRIGFLDQTLSLNNFNGVSDRYELEFQQFLKPHTTMRLNWGTAYRWDEMRNDQTGSDRLNAESARLSSTLEWRPSNRFVVNLGAMLENNTVTDGTAFSPRFGLNYKVADEHTLRIALTRAHKFPSLLEENWNSLFRLEDGTPFLANIVSSGDLSRETRKQAEIGYLGRGLAGALTLDARLYHEDVQDAVVYAFDYDCPEQPFFHAGCNRVSNLIDYRVTGLETLLTYRPGPRDMVRLQYAYADTSGKTPLTLNPVSYQDLSSTAPRHSGSLLLSHVFPHQIEGSIVWYYMDDLFWYLDGLRTLDDYHRVDLRLAKSFGGEKHRGLIELIVQNVGDDYNEFAPRNLFDTRVYLRAGIQLH